RCFLTGFNWFYVHLLAWQYQSIWKLFLHLCLHSCTLSVSSPTSPLLTLLTLSFLLPFPPLSLQRPTAKELLKHKLIVRYAKKTSYLTELVDKYRRWKAEQTRQQAESSSDESDSEQDGQASGGNNFGSDDWIFTIREKDPKKLQNGGEGQAVESGAVSKRLYSTSLSTIISPSLAEVRGSLLS
uniref:Protein kinase domain-containing protein n=1 Tax=Hucho hucho TaxID=62062 RepID=A0A4W5L955_9TELE